MADLSRVKLFGKLNPLAYKAMESATVFCKLRGNPYVELVHWISQIAEQQDSDLQRICSRFGVDGARLAKDITAALDRLPRGSSSITDLSGHLDDAVERGFVYASLMFGESPVRTGHVVIGLLKTRALRSVFLSISKEFEKIDGERLTESLAEIVSGSPEDAMVCGEGSAGTGGALAAPGEASGAMAPAAMGKQEALERFSVDLTARARGGEMDPIVGRDEEIRQIVDILMRRKQNNPMLTGEAGVGKTAVVEGFAQRIASGDVPPPLRDVTLRVLDIGLLQAGASMKGEFENRLRQVIDEVQASPKPIILFIDEAHTLIGAGGAAGTGDAANLLKPALARGALRTIAATTWAEYKKHIEKDPALTRRFQVVQIGEPTEAKALLMMRGLASTLEKHHRVLVLDAALDAAVRLSHRYIPARQLPDKAVSLLDTACARVAISQHAVPAEVEDSRRRIAALQTELEIIGREEAVGIDAVERRGKAEARLEVEAQQLATLQERWDREKNLVDSILSLRADLRGQGAAVDADAGESVPAAGGGGESSDRAVVGSTAHGASTGSATGGDGKANGKLGETDIEQTVGGREALLQRLAAVQDELASLQGETPLIMPSVDEASVASVVGDWTGIPVGRMVKNEIETVLQLPRSIGQRVLGQDHALQMIGRRIQTSRAGLEDPNKPIGVFLLAGPSGVGKTETALALAESLYGGEQNLITINMSEFQEAHTVSTLKGAPPGYVGYGEGGVLTEAVRRRPYSVVLLDEVEKAHPDVHEIFFQVFDKGWMEDGEGRTIDFKNTLILLTTNVGSELILGTCAAGARPQQPSSQGAPQGTDDGMPPPEQIARALRPDLLRVFPAALLGRLVVIPYYPLDDGLIGNIARLQLERVAKRIRERYDVPFTVDDGAVHLITSRCTELESGGRMIDAVLTNTLLPRISQEMLERMLQEESISGVHVGVENGDFSYRFEDGASPESTTAVGPAGD